ncbi:MAG: 30S ribosomal protein S6 [Candidatus Margulisbacteria bacterium]|jgi:small subunit ribosomal protein S6|nr:30S ribosomal protein S6 [Candidatus Margulisiibacteriota bacterium]
MTAYDLLFIIKSGLEEAAQKEILEKVKALIENGGGKVETVDVWGKRDLATPIEKNQQGYFVLVKYSGPGAINKELEARFKINENVLRYMITLSLSKPKVEAKA